MPDPLRDPIAIGICLLSATMGAVSLLRNSGNVYGVATGVGSVWCVTSGWLGNHFTRQAWKRLNRPLSAIYEDARQGRLVLPRDRPVVRIMNHGGSLLMLAGLASLFM